MFIVGIILIVVSAIWLVTVASNLMKSQQLSSDHMRREFVKDSLWAGVVPLALLIGGVWLVLR